MPRFIVQTFIILFLVLLCFDGSLGIKRVSMNNQPCFVRPMLIDMNPVELHYYQFIVSMKGCTGSYDTRKDPFGRICFPNKMKDVNLKVCNMIKGINESKTLAKHVSC